MEAYEPANSLGLLTFSILAIFRERGRLSGRYAEEWEQGKNCFNLNDRKPVAVAI
jgi:hypothetical protein